MKAAFFVTWSPPVPGREKKAIEFFREFNDFFAKWAAEDKCSEPEWFVGPDGHYVWFVKGDYETLLKLYTLPKIQEFFFEGPYVYQEFDFRFYFVGTEEYFKTYEGIGRKFGLM